MANDQAQSAIGYRPSAIGHIFQLNISPTGGVPKRAVHEAVVDALGIVGNRVAHPKIHGGTERALCLYSLERILALQTEGHPIFPGAVGENVTIAGLDWTLVVPGVRLRLGDAVLLEVTKYTTPCATITAAFKDGDSNRIWQTRHEGWARVYAKVVRDGRVRVGNGATLMEQGWTLD